VKHALRFRPEIPDDIAEACRWYENRGTGLGGRFLRELDATFSRIAIAPEAYGKGERDVRSARMRRFPYIVHFKITGKEVIVLAVMYGGRDSAVLRNRT
jgi:plasmid stabilization system protein ParE